MSNSAAIKQFILDEFLPDVHESEVGEDLDLIESGVIDSLGLLKVIAWLEGHFRVPIDIAEMVPENFCSVAAIGAVLGRAQAALRAGELARADA
jgi:acyl carrier protein